MPILKISINPYVYCENSCINTIDESGKYKISIIDLAFDWAGIEILTHYLYGNGKKIPFSNPKNYVLQIKWTQKLNLKV